MRNQVTLPILLVATAVGLGAPQDIAKTMFHSTVMITTQDQKGRPQAIGSGFVLKPGFIVSNFHVVEGAGSAQVYRHVELRRFPDLGQDIQVRRAGLDG